MCACYINSYDFKENVYFNNPRETNQINIIFIEFSFDILSTFSMAKHIL